MGAIRVLHVDDDEAFLETSKMLLESADSSLDVQTVASAEAGLERLRAGEQVDCVVSDYDMPGLDGIDFLKIVRDEFPGLPFVLFTGQGSEAVASEAISAGVTDYLQKAPGSDAYTLLANRVTNAVDRRSAERRVQRQATAMDMASEGIAILDGDGCYTEVNRKYAEIHRLSPEEMTGTHYGETLDDEAEARLASALEEVPVGQEWTADLVARRADGESFTKRISLHRLESDSNVVVAQDTTEARVSDRFSRSTEAPTPTDLVHTVGDMLYAFDADGRFSFVNETFCEALSVDPSALLGEHFSAITAEADIDTAVEAFESVADPKTATTDTTYQKRVLTGDGEWVPVETHIARLPGESFRGVVGVVRDISERRDRLARLQAQNERLDEIATFISHDLKTPLTTLEGCLSAIETDDTDLVDRAVETVQRMSEMTESVSELAAEGWQVDRREEVRVETLATEAWDHVETDGATLEVDLPGERRLHGDREKLVHVFENLFKNAVDHCRSPQVRVTATADGLLVADDGPGIPPEEREDVFRLGYAGDGASGIGLAHVARNVAAHGWEIRATDSPDGGAAFEIVTAGPDLSTAADVRVDSDD